MKVRNITEKSAVLTSVPAGVTIRILGGETKELDGGFAYLRDDPRFEVFEEEEKPAEGKPEKSKGGSKAKGTAKEPEEGGGPKE